MSDDAARAAQAAFAEFKTRAVPIDDAGLDLLSREARTVNGWLDRPVADETLTALYDLMKWAPTSANCSPARIVFVKSREAKERLKPALMGSNADKTMAAPVCAILGFDERFFVHLPRLFPAYDMGKNFRNNPEAAHTAAFRNATLQGGYFILAARAMGLDCGPMSGFKSAMVDDTFFAGTAIRSNFLCNLGYGDPATVHPRGPRLAFAEACSII